MFSTFPSTPRGRSRFSKVLPPQPPEDNSSSLEEHPRQSLLKSALPPLPNSKAMSIPRRPVGGQAKHSTTPSTASASSLYSGDDPGLSRSLSNGSSYNAFEIDSTPPLPPKDNQRSQTTSASPTILSSPLSSLRSSPRPEIWKRRSGRSEKSFSFTELKLDRSNGSTASPPRKQEPPTRSHPPRSIGSRKPIPVRPAPPQPDFSSQMGNKLAKELAKAKDKDLGAPSVTVSNDGAAKQYTTFQRLPTPEYQLADKPQHRIPQISSPATPPEEQPPIVPSKSEARPNVAPAPVLSESTNRSNILPSHSRDPSETLTIASEPAVMKSPQPKKAFATKILTPQPSPDKASPLSLPSPLSPLAAAAGLGINFPTISSLAAAGAVIPGLPLDITHFDCYNSHKLMRSSRNTICPIGCMICQKLDNEPRWKCTWCCLSACGSCVQVLSSVPGKDLKVCLERIGRSETELAPR